MNSRTILGISLAAVFALSMIMMPVYAGGHLGIDKAKMTVHQKKGEIDLKVKVGAKIPKDESGAFGWALLGWNSVLVLVTHVPAFDDSIFDDKKGAFHTHVLNLLPVSTSFCPEAEVDLDATITDPGYKNKVGKDKFSIKKVPLTDLNGLDGSGTKTVAGIALSVVEEIISTEPLVVETHLCVDVKGTLTPEVKLKK